MRARAALSGLAVALVATAAAAHVRSISYSTWTLDDSGAIVAVRIPLLELSRLALDPSRDMGSGGPAARYLAEHLLLRVGDQACRVPEPPLALPAQEGWAHFRWRIECASSGPVAIESHVLLDVAPSHLHFARVTGAGAGPLEHILTEGEPRWALPAPDAPAPGATGDASLGGSVGRGALQLLSGWDHLAFLVALLLAAGSLSELALTVGSFALAHSTTLALGVLGVLRPDAAAVGALAGLGVALVAAENAWLLAGRGVAVPALVTACLAGAGLLAVAGVGAVPPAALLGLALFSLCHFGLLARAARPVRPWAALAFAFGLVHGLGLAAALGARPAPAPGLAPVLLGFNIGVELALLAVVALLWAALRALERRGAGLGRPVAEAGSAALCGLGLYWFLVRALA